MTEQFYIPDDVKKTLHSRKRNLEPGEEDSLMCPEGCTIDHTDEDNVVMSRPLPSDKPNVIRLWSRDTLSDTP